MPNQPPTQARPASAGLRASIERVSLPVLVRLAALPRAVPFAVLLAALVGGLLTGGPVGVLLTAFVLLVVVWMTYLGWPRLGVSERLGRLAVTLMALALFVTQAFPR